MVKFIISLVLSPVIFILILAAVFCIIFSVYRLRKKGKVTRHINIAAAVSVIFLVFAAISFIMYRQERNFYFIFLVWNIILAFLPIVFIKLSLYNFSKRRRFLAYFYGCLWLLFFPNTPYLITDHVNTLAFIPAGKYHDIFSWVKLTHTGFGVFFGISVGMYSLYSAHRAMAKRMNKIIAHTALAVICLLSGYAIYIGRFLRINSWDVLRPLYLIRRLTGDLSLFTLQYTLLMAATTLLLYISCSLIYKITDSKENTNRIPKDDNKI